MNAFRLYEIAPEIQKIFDAVDDGELSPGDFQKLTELNEVLERKALNIACLVKNYMAEADAIDAEIKRLKERKDAASNKAERLKEYLAKNIPEGETYQDARAKISWRKSTSVDVADECIEDLPKQYKTVKVIVSPDKRLLKEALESGKKFEGVELVKRSNIQIK